MKWVSALSKQTDIDAAVQEATEEIIRKLGKDQADLTVAPTKSFTLGSTTIVADSLGRNLKQLGFSKSWERNWWRRLG